MSRADPIAGPDPPPPAFDAFYDNDGRAPGYTPLGGGVMRPISPLGNVEGTDYFLEVLKFPSVFTLRRREFLRNIDGYLGARGLQPAGVRGRAYQSLTVDGRWFPPFLDPRVAGHAA